MGSPPAANIFTNRGLQAKLLLAALAGPCVWGILYWVFDQPLASRLHEARVWGLTDTAFLHALLFAVLIYPLLEEIVFRGALQGFLIERLSGKRLPNWLGGLSLANLITSVVFAAMHLFNQSPLWAALIFFPSLVFGWAREATGGLMAPVLLHMFYNAGFYFLFVQV